MTVGHLLGDGSAKFTGKNWLLEFGQTHKEFTFWLYGIFKPWTTIVPYLSVNCWRFNTRVIPEIAALCWSFYPDAIRNKLGKKIVPSNIGE